MQTINLVNSKKSDVSYKVIQFPDGEQHIVFEDEINRKEFYNIKCRISNANELFILMQVGDILNRQGVEFDIYIYYLMSMRMDRVISFNESFSLRVVANMINSLNAKRVYILEAHSNRTFSEIKNSFPLENTAFDMIVNKSLYTDVLVFPDAGAEERYFDKFKDKSVDIIKCKKRRELGTGKLLSFEIDHDTSNLLINMPMLVIDDLCDGGGTFLGIGKLLKDKYPEREMNIFVTHMVNPKGIENLSKTYDNVYFTNSYKDWNLEKLPKNVHIINCY